MSDTIGSPGQGILKPSWIWRDGTLIPFADATVHVLSHMSARGSQIFDVLLAVAGPDGLRALGLREHVARFIHSAETMGMEGLPEIGSIECAIADTVVANLEADGIAPAASAPLVIKLIASWDDPAMGIAPKSLTPNLYIAVTPWSSDPAEVEAFKQPAAPIKVKTAAMPKIPASVLPPSMKVAAGYTPGIRHHLKAAAEGFDQVLFRTVEGDMAEGVTSSFFAVGKGRIAVPPVDSVLDGITRRVVLDVAQAVDIPYQIRPVRW
ncbi:MAG: aminotransferase class IV, partial [Acidimicrobiia bacterium]|nr:aminotransferase class IV [Acidimicrobiia bacterium]